MGLPDLKPQPQQGILRKLILEESNFIPRKITRHPEVKLLLWGAFIMRPPAGKMSEIKFHLIRWNWQ